jgi:hypothetical protein
VVDRQTPLRYRRHNPTGWSVSMSPSFLQIASPSAPARIWWAGFGFSWSVLMDLLRSWASCLDPSLNNQGVSTTTALRPTVRPSLGPTAAYPRQHAKEQRPHRAMAFIRNPRVRYHP